MDALVDGMSQAGFSDEAREDVVRKIGESANAQIAAMRNSVKAASKYSGKSWREEEEAIRNDYIDKAFSISPSMSGNGFFTDEDNEAYMQSFDDGTTIKDIDPEKSGKGIWDVEVSDGTPLWNTRQTLERKRVLHEQAFEKRAIDELVREQVAAFPNADPAEVRKAVMNKSESDPDAFRKEIDKRSRKMHMTDKARRIFDQRSKARKPGTSDAAVESLEQQITFGV
jgi:hypothetical protein